MAASGTGCFRALANAAYRQGLDFNGARSMANPAITGEVDSATTQSEDGHTEWAMTHWDGAVVCFHGGLFNERPDEVATDHFTMWAFASQDQEPLDASKVDSTSVTVIDTEKVLALLPPKLVDKTVVEVCFDHPGNMITSSTAFLVVRGEGSRSVGAWRLVKKKT